MTDDKTTSRRKTGSSSVPRLVPKPDSSMKEGYDLPVIGVTLPPRLVEVGFYGALLGSAALGVIDAPLAMLIGAGVVIARHRRS